MDGSKASFRKASPDEEDSLRAEVESEESFSSVELAEGSKETPFSKTEELEADCCDEDGDDDDDDELDGDDVVVGVDD